MTFITNAGSLCYISMTLISSDQSISVPLVRGVNLFSIAKEGNLSVIGMKRQRHIGRVASKTVVMLEKAVF